MAEIWMTDAQLATAKQIRGHAAEMEHVFQSAAESLRELVAKNEESARAAGALHDRWNAAIEREEARRG